MTGSVYMITCIITNRIYVGSSVNINKRWSYYKKLNCSSQVKLYNSFLKHGLGNHTFKEIWKGDIKDMLKYEAMIGIYYEALDREKGLNLKLPKINDKYSCVSEETKLKQSIAKIGHSMPENTKMAINKANKGRKREYKSRNLSKEQRDKIRERALKNNLGKIKYPLIEKGREKIRISSRNRICSEESKEKISNSNSVPIIQLDLNNNILKSWKSARQASKILNINYKNICSVCRNKRITAGGFKWKYE